MPSHIKKEQLITSYLPETIPHFSGRINILENINQTFKEKQIIILYSIPGIGKSSIANKYAWKLKDVDDQYIINWMESENDFKLLNSFQNFYQRISSNHHQIDLINKQNLIKQINAQISSMPTKFLFIFDDCQETTNIKDYLANIPNNVKVLITTNKEIDSLGHSLIRIDPFDQEETKEFISNTIDIDTSIQPNELEILTDSIFDYFKTEFTPYTLNKLMGIIRLELESNEEFGSDDLEIDDLMNENKLFELLQFVDEYALEILFYSSFMDPDFIPINIFTEILKLEPKSTISAVKTLKYKLLISIEEKDQIKGIKIHRLLQEEIQQYLESNQLNQYLNRIKKKLIIMLKIKNHYLNTINHYYNFKQMIKHILSGSIKDEEKSELLFLFANFNQNYKEYDLALENYQESLRIYRSGSDNKSLIGLILNNIGMIYHIQGKNSLALENYQESLGLIENSSISALVQNNIGLAYQAENKLDLALTNFTESLRNDSSNSASILNNIGNIYNSQGKYDLALNNYQESLRLNRLESEENSNISTILNNIAVVYNSQGKCDLALENLKESMRILKLSINTNEHSGIADIFNNIGNVYTSQAKYDLALINYKESLRINRQVYVSDEMNSSIADTLNNIGNIYASLGKYDLALVNYKESLRIFRLLYDSGKQFSIADLFFNIGNIYKSQEKYDLALINYRESLNINRLLFGSDENAAIADIFNSIGNVYNGQGKFELALKNYQESLRIKRFILGSDEDASIADTFINIGNVFNSLGNYDLVLENYKESLRIFRLQFGTDENLNIATTFNNIGTVYFNQSKYELALDNYLQALRIFRSIFRSDEHPLLILVIKNIESVNQKI